MSVIVKGEQVIVDIECNDLKVGEVVFSTHLSIDKLSHILDDNVRREIVFCQSVPTNVTILNLKICDSGSLDYIIKELVLYLRYHGYKSVTVFVDDTSKEEYMDLGFKPLEFIKEDNTWFMMKSINF